MGTRQKAFWSPQHTKFLDELTVYDLFALGAGLKAGLEKPKAEAEQLLQSVESILASRGRSLELLGTGNG